MSFQSLQAVRSANHPLLTPAIRLVWETLEDAANAGREVWHSIASIAARAGVGRRTVTRALAVLRRIGVLIDTGVRIGRGVIKWFIQAAERFASPQLALDFGDAEPAVRLRPLARVRPAGGGDVRSGQPAAASADPGASADPRQIGASAAPSRRTEAFSEASTTTARTPAMRPPSPSQALPGPVRALATAIWRKLSGAEPSQPERRAYLHVAQHLDRIGATPEQAAERAERCKQRYPACGPRAVLNHWGELAVGRG